jgi:2,4-dienoyl-CoA reductase
MSTVPSSSSYVGKFVLITGGGTGLGLNNALEFASRGAVVAITGRRLPVLQAARKEIDARAAAAGHTGTRAVAVQMDVRSPESVAAGVDEAVAAAGGKLPSVVLNNAAGNFISPAERLSPNAWKAIIDIVLMGTIHVTTDIGRRWIAHRKDAQQDAPQPQVVFMNVGTSYVGQGAPFLAPSAAAKSAVLSVLQSLSVEWGRHNIRMFMVSPGPIHTEGANSRLDPTGKGFAKAAKALPLRRAGRIEEYSRFVAHLCSDECAWLTGANIHFDGGSKAAGGEFQGLQQITGAQWDIMATAIRKTSAAQKKLTKSHL